MLLIWTNDGDSDRPQQNQTIVTLEILVEQILVHWKNHTHKCVSLVTMIGQQGNCITSGSGYTSSCQNSWQNWITSPDTP